MMYQYVMILLRELIDKYNYLIIRYLSYIISIVNI